MDQFKAAQDNRSGGLGDSSLNTLCTVIYARVICHPTQMVYEYMPLMYHVNGLNRFVGRVLVLGQLIGCLAYLVIHLLDQ